MKKSILICFLCASLLAAAQQPDTCVLKNGTTLTGTVQKFYSDRILLKLEDKEEVMVLFPSLKHFKNETYGTVSKMIELEKFYDMPAWKDSKDYLRTGATIGAISVVMQTAGAVLAGIGAWKSENSLIYIGAGLGGGGFVLQVPAWLLILKSTNVESYKEF